MRTEIGVSAISTVGEVYAQNCKSLKDYNARIDAGELAVERGVVTSAEDRLRRDVIGALMCDFHADLAAIGRAHGVDGTDHFAQELERLAAFEADGLVRIDGSVVDVTPRGRFLIRNICMTFDAYLAPATEAFSKAI